MKHRAAFWLILLLPFLLSLQIALPSSVRAAPNQQSNSVQVYYRLAANETCGLHGPISLGDFIKKTLPFEWVDGWAGTSNGDQALKAGAVAIRTWVLSAANARVYTVNGQNFYCIDAWPSKINFRSDRVIDQTYINTYPNSIAAVNATNGVIMIHPDAPLLLGIRAIDAQFRAKTGENTQAGPSSKPWLKSIYDPISAGELPSNNPQGMGQYGSKRWAWGLNEAGQAYPKWDYRRILVHYYTGIEFVGATNPNPPEGFRANMLKIEGVSANDLTLCKGEERTGIRVLYQNTGQWPVDGTDSQGLCSGAAVSDYKTLLGHHLYQSSGSTPACSTGSNCIGIRRTPMCRISAIQPGEHFWVNGFKIAIPDDSALVKGNTYQLRFDVEHRHNGVWDGFPNYNWPGQDIPVTICGGSDGGGGSVRVRILDHPPAVVSYNTLNNGYFRFSWQGINQPDGYDIQYRSKEISQASYPANFEAPSPLQNMHPTITEIPIPVYCGLDRRDWQFRIRADKIGQPSSDWVYVEAQTRV